MIKLLNIINLFIVILFLTGCEKTLENENTVSEPHRNEKINNYDNETEAQDNKLNSLSNNTEPGALMDKKDNHSNYIEEEIDTSNWKIHKGDKHGYNYSFNFPNDWVERETNLVTTKNFNKRKPEAFEFQDTNTQSYIIEYDAQIKIELFENNSQNFTAFINSSACVDKKEVKVQNTNATICKKMPEGMSIFSAYFPIKTSNLIFSLRASSNEKKYTSENLLLLLRQISSTVNID